jgi:hypothetical protein
VNNQQEQYFPDFESLLSLCTGAYQCAVISYVGVKTTQGSRLLFGRVLLEPTRAGVSDTPFRFETEHLIAARFVSGATPADIQSFLVKARNGEILSIDGATSIPIQSDGNLSTFFSPIYHPSVSGGPRLPSLRVSGTSTHNLTASISDLRVLDWELKAAEAPFDNLDELLRQCGLPTQTQMGSSSTLELVAKSPALISDASAISGSDAMIECRLAIALDIGKLRLGYKILHKECIERKSMSGSELDWQQDGDIRVGICRAPVGDASLLQAFVSYAGVSHHQWWVIDPKKRLNPRHAIHQVFDEDLELLRRMLLKPEVDKPYEFENSVSTLLNLLGFSVSNYGRIPKLQKGPDVIAISSAGNVGVVECTVGLPDRNDKLAKLVQRSTLIRDKLNTAGYRFLQLQAVIVTPLSRDEVTADLETAGKHGIAVVCKENIEAMLRQVNLPPNSDKLFDDSKTLIPNATQGSLFLDNT